MMMKKIYVCDCCGKHQKMELPEEESQYMDDCMLEDGWLLIDEKWYCKDCTEQEA